MCAPLFPARDFCGLKEFFQANFSFANLSQPLLHERQINSNLRQRFLAMTPILKPDLIDSSNSRVKLRFLGCDLLFKAFKSVSKGVQTLECKSPQKRRSLFGKRIEFLVCPSQDVNHRAEQIPKFGANLFVARLTKLNF